MTPILSTTSKWTPFPTELSDQIKELFTEQFQPQIPQCKIWIEGRFYPEEIHFRAGYRPEDQITQYNFEICSTYSKKTEVKEAIDRCIDLAASMLQEHIDGKCDVEELPRNWKQIETKLYLQYSTVNPELELAADKFLEEVDDSLVRNAGEDFEDALDQALVLDDPQVLEDIVKRFRSKKKSDEDDESSSETFLN